MKLSEWIEDRFAKGKQLSLVEPSRFPSNSDSFCDRYTCMGAWLQVQSALFPFFNDMSKTVGIRYDKTQALFDVKQLCDFAYHPSHSLLRYWLAYQTYHGSLKQIVAALPVLQAALPFLGIGSKLLIEGYTILELAVRNESVPDETCKEVLTLLLKLEPDLRALITGADSLLRVTLQLNHLKVLALILCEYTLDDCSDLIAMSTVYGNPGTLCVIEQHFGIQSASSWPGLSARSLPMHMQMPPGVIFPEIKSVLSAFERIAELAIAFTCCADTCLTRSLMLWILHAVRLSPDAGESHRPLRFLVELLACLCIDGLWEQADNVLNLGEAVGLTRAYIVTVPNWIKRVEASSRDSLGSKVFLASLYA